LFAGALANWMGRKPLMTLSGVLFVASIPIIALAQGYWPLVLGRLLQGVSVGLIVFGRAALSGGMPERGGSRQGHRDFPMVAYLGLRGGGDHRHLFQCPGG